MNNRPQSALRAQRKEEDKPLFGNFSALFALSAVNSDPHTPQRFDRVDWLLLAGLLLLAGFLRGIDPGWTEFKADEARLLSLAWEMAEGARFPLRGIASSVGVPNFPASVWVYALPLAIWPHVYAPTLFTAFLNTAAVGLCYWLVRRFWGREAAVIAALLFAVNPWAIIHSRKIWAQNLLPILTMGWGIGGMLALVEGRRRWLILHIFCAAFAFQVHLAAVSLLAATAALLLIYRRRVAWQPLLLGGGLALLTALPFFYYLVFQAEGGAAALLGGGGGRDGGFSLAPLAHAVRLSTGWEMHALAGPQAFELFLAQTPDGRWAAALWLLLLGIGAIALLRDGRQRTGPAPFLLIWLTVPVLTFVWFPTPVELHYLLPLYPAGFIAAGLGGSWLARWLRWGIWPLVLAPAVLQAWLWLALLAFLQGQPTPGGFGEPLRFQLEAAAVARALMAEHGAPELLIAGTGEEPLLDEQAAIYDLHLRDMPRRFVDLTRSAVFPAAGGVVLVPAVETPLADLIASQSAAGRSVPRRPGEGSLDLFYLPPAAAPAPLLPLAEPPLLANFVSLLGVSAPEGVADWRLTWRVGTPAPVDYHFFNHLHDEDGRRIAQADAAAWPAAQWRAGDVVVSRFTLEPPAGASPPWVMRTGMYVYPSLASVPLLDEAANPYADAVEIPVP